MGEGRLLALLGIVLLSLGMRSAVTSFAPVFAAISAEIGIGPVVLGIVGALPPFAFAAAGVVTPLLARRLGDERALLVAIAAIVLGQAVRALAADGFGVIASTAVTMVGIGVGNVLLPSLAKRYFAQRIGLVTAIYSLLFAVGGTSPAFLAVPVSDLIGWRPTLAIWAVTIAFAAIPWLVLVVRARSVGSDAGSDVPALPGAGETGVRLIRSPLAWALILTLWASAMVGYGGAAWLPLILVERGGLDEAAAGAHLGIALLVGIPASLLVPLVAARPRPAAALVALAGVLGSVGWAAVVFLPDVAPTVWAVLIGCGAITFPLVLVQIAVRAATPRLAVRLSAFVQSAAYILTGCTVLALGVLNDLTGDWTLPLGVFLAISALSLVAVPVIARPGRVDDPR